MQTPSKIGFREKIGDIRQSSAGTGPRYQNFKHQLGDLSKHGSRYLQHKGGIQA
jgi:hypothetical protein